MERGFVIAAVRRCHHRSFGGPVRHAFKCALNYASTRESGCLSDNNVHRNTSSGLLVLNPICVNRTTPGLQSLFSARLHFEPTPARFGALNLVQADPDGRVPVESDPPLIERSPSDNTP